MRRNRPSLPRWVMNAKEPICAACGSTEDLNYHHLVPRFRGGEDVPENIIVLCASCHHKLHEKGGNVSASQLIKEGIAKAHAAGKRLGNPHKRIDHEPIIRLIAQHSTQFNSASLLTEDEVREMAGVKVTCYAECKNELLAALDQPVYMPICLAMVQAADAIVCLAGSEHSQGARIENDYAGYQGKTIYYGIETVPSIND